jgi:hypothetical protein
MYSKGSEEDTELITADLQTFTTPKPFVNMNELRILKFENLATECIYRINRIVNRYNSITSFTIIVKIYMAPMIKSS